MDNTLRELNIDYRGFRSDFPKNRECIAEERVKRRMDEKAE